jgi:curved DNA-binding protein CbpA
MSDDETVARIDAWIDVLDRASYYQLLGVLPRADGEALRRAFHEFARAFHPDSHVGTDERTLEKVRRVFQRGAEAYRVLGNPELRLRYDIALQKNQLRLEPESGRPGADFDAGKALHELCRSPGAKLAAQNAAKRIEAGDLAGARAQLVRALEQDGGVNPALQKRLEALEIALYAMGG